MRNLLGGKGAGLAEMAQLGLPVPPGFTITTEVCTYFYAHGKTYPKELKAQVEAALAEVGRITGKKFGDGGNPLLVSVRSGARASMPGMMDTVLNLGLNDVTVAALAEKSGDRRFAYDSYRRFITMYSDVVLGIAHHHFEEILDDHKDRNGYHARHRSRRRRLGAVVADYKERVESETRQAVPAGPARAIVGRDRRRVRLVDEPARHHLSAPARHSGKLGHRGQCAGHGVRQYGRDLGHRRRLHAQSVDRREEALRRISHQCPGRGRGRRHPHAAGNHRRGAQGGRLRQAVDGRRRMPEAFAELKRIHAKLEQHYRDMQDLEFTVEQGKLWMLQTRNGKRTAKAALRIAVELAQEKLITKEEAVTRVDPAALDQLLHPTIDPNAERKIIATGLPASPGAACGEIVFSSEEAETLKSQGRKVILVRVETSPEDIHGMHAAEGILTTRGGMTSHAAVVARGMGKPCVSGAGSLRVDYRAQTMTAGGMTLKKGDTLTIDGSTGQVLAGKVAMLRAGAGRRIRHGDEMGRRPCAN